MDKKKSILWIVIILIIVIIITATVIFLGKSKTPNENSNNEIIETNTPIPNSISNNEPISPTPSQITSPTNNPEESNSPTPTPYINEQGFISSSSNITGLNVIETKKYIDGNPDIVIVDVSSQSKFTQGHIPNAINYPLANLNETIKTLDKNKKYLVYSREDSDSRIATQKMASNGFTDVSYLKGSYGIWLQLGYKIEKGSTTQTSTQNATIGIGIN